MRKLNLLVVMLAVGVIAWAGSVKPVHAVAHNAVLTAQDEDAPAAPETQEAETQTFMGKIMSNDGKYSLQGEDGKTYQLDNQDKAKDFDGKKVSVTGSLDEESMTIHVTNIEEDEG